jgi:hypothetical protein
MNRQIVITIIASAIFMFAPVLPLEHTFVRVPGIDDAPHFFVVGERLGLVGTWKGIVQLNTEAEATDLISKRPGWTNFYSLVRGYNQVYKIDPFLLKE